MAQPDYLILGRVVKRTGVRGEVKMACFADSWEPFRRLGQVWLGPPEGPLREFTLEGGRAQDRWVVLQLAGVDTPEAAARLVGLEVSIPRVEAPPPPEGVFYHYDILGLVVVEGERVLGTVSEILEVAAHDVYVVRGKAGEWMLPATRTHIRRIDLAAGRIEIVSGMDLITATSGGDESAESV
jgi:16S rRNA processing protein RimM